MESWLIHMLDSARGVYIPRDFAEFAGWDGISSEDREVLESGPDHPDYWGTWERVLDNATFDIDGITYSLLHDGDLWAYRDPRGSAELEEFIQFFGERFNDE